MNVSWKLLIRRWTDEFVEEHYLWSHYRRSRIRYRIFTKVRHVKDAWKTCSKYGLYPHNPSIYTLFMIFSYLPTIWPEKYGRVFLVACKKWHVHCPVSTVHSPVSTVQCPLSSVSYCTRIHLTSHFIQGARNTRPCITGHPIPWGGIVCRWGAVCWWGGWPPSWTGSQNCGLWADKYRNKRRYKSGIFFLTLKNMWLLLPLNVEFQPFLPKRY